MASELQIPVEALKEETSTPAIVSTVVIDEPVAPVASGESSIATPTVAAAPAGVDATKSDEDKPELVETTPIDEGVLEHKKSAGFPKNLIFTKQTFWFGTDALDHKDLHSYTKSEKFSDIAKHNAAWASTTGGGLLFYGEKKGHVAGIVNLADTTEPESDGNQKFHFSYNGVKHTLRAHSKEHRDTWVSQLKNQIFKAKGNASTVTEGTAYKTALESYKTKPAPSPLLAQEETSKPEPTSDSKVDDAADDSAREDRPTGRRSASRKRLSVFSFNRKAKKDDEKREEDGKDDLSPTTAAVVDIPAASSPTAVTAADLATDSSPTLAPAGAVAPDAKDSLEQTKPVTESSDDKANASTTGTLRPSVLSKRSSIFGILKRDKRSPTTLEAPSPGLPTDALAISGTETAPVIPPVETATPLAVELSPATVPTETVELPLESPTEKKEMKSEKRKSSLPFAFLPKKDKTAIAEDGASEKKDKQGMFSLIRNTIKRYPASFEKPTERSEGMAEKADVPAGGAAASPATVEESLVETPQLVRSSHPISDAEKSATNEIPASAPVTAAA